MRCGAERSKLASFKGGAELAQIEFDDVSKIYDDGTQAVENLDLAIEDGELMVLVGPSGCGKTTALRMVAGLEEITEGELRIGDRIVNDLTPKERNIAMVFQSYALYPHMTVEENLAFSLKLARCRRRRSASESSGRPTSSRSRSTSSASRGPSPAASASEWPWAGRSCASPRPSSWTSRSPTSTRS